VNDSLVPVFQVYRACRARRSIDADEQDVPALQGKLVWFGKQRIPLVPFKVASELRVVGFVGGLDSADIETGLEEIVQAFPSIDTHPGIGGIIGVDGSSDGRYGDGGRYCGERVPVWHSRNRTAPYVRAETSWAYDFIEM
jgi:hypothetical protein